MLAIKGHPLHTAFIHFPVACFFLSFLTDLFGRSIGLVEPEIFSFYLSFSGLSFGLFAVITGLTDMSSIKGSINRRTGWIHGLLNLTWMGVFGYYTLIKWDCYPGIAAPDTAELFIKGMVILGIFYSDFLGAELVYSSRRTNDGKAGCEDHKRS
jgi:uncharacterized membrane protein